MSEKKKHSMWIKVGIRYSGMCKLKIIDKYDCTGNTVIN